MTTQKEELANLPGVERLRLIAMVKYLSPEISSHQSPALARWGFSVTGPLIWNQSWAPSYKPHTKAGLVMPCQQDAEVWGSQVAPPGGLSELNQSTLLGGLSIHGRGHKF